MKGQLTIQNYKSYSKNDQEAWRVFFENAIARLNPEEKRNAKFLESIKKLKLKKGEIPEFETLNKVLKPLANFEVMAVTGELENSVLFHLLRSRKYPIVVTMPELFNEVFNLTPLLTDKAFGDELVGIAINATANPTMLDEYRTQLNNFLIKTFLINETNTTPEEVN
jgi:phenylalanine-4-hydroxylase